METGGAPRGEMGRLFPGRKPPDTQLPGATNGVEWTPQGSSSEFVSPGVWHLVPTSSLEILAGGRLNGASVLTGNDGWLYSPREEKNISCSIHRGLRKAPKAPQEEA